MLVLLCAKPEFGNQNAEYAYKLFLLFYLGLLAQIYFSLDAKH